MGVVAQMIKLPSPIKTLRQKLSFNVSHVEATMPGTEATMPGTQSDMANLAEDSIYHGDGGNLAEESMVNLSVSVLWQTTHAAYKSQKEKLKAFERDYVAKHGRAPYEKSEWGGMWEDCKDAMTRTGGYASPIATSAAADHVFSSACV